MADTDRARLYAAEQLVRALFDSADETGVRTATVHGSTITLPVERRFATIASVQDYVDRVLSLNWVGTKWRRARLPLRVRSRAGQKRAHYEPIGVIALPPHVKGCAWAMRELVVLHELAHHLTGTGDHGTEFVHCFTTLVGEIIGPEAGFVLRCAIYENGVRGEPHRAS